MDFKLEISNIIHNVSNIDKNEIMELLEIPANKQMGDFAFPCFKLAKIMKKSPNIIAQEFANIIYEGENLFLEKVEAVNAYINFYIDKVIFISQTIGEILHKKENYIKSEIGKGKTIVIDYSSPNIAKTFHVGHLRSTVIGNALYKIYKTLGYECIGINYLGDWGTQFGKMIVAYQLWGNKEAVERDDIKELSRIYVKYHEEVKKNLSLDDEARAWLVKMEEGNKEALELWKWFCEISMKEYSRIYDRLDISFDSYNGESFYNDKMHTVVEEIKNKNLLVESQGAKIVDLELYNMPPCLILRSDGGTLYPTRDIAAALYRKKEYNFEKCLYITALDQNLHFAQWFKVIDLMGYDWAKNLIHIPFGLVSLGDGKLSTRKGHVVLMEDILNGAVEKASEIIEQKNPDLENKEKVAEEIGIGAIIFNDLYNSRIKNVVFDYDRMVNFDGETGPYVQYTHARACSILRKENINIEQLLNGCKIDFSLITDEVSLNLCKILSQFPEKLVDSVNKNEPYIIVRQIMEICQGFNRFYNENNIKDSEEQLKRARISVVYCTKIIIKAGLALIGIKAPEQM